MALTLYSHPFSSYRQKLLIALWENERRSTIAIWNRPALRTR